MFHDHNISQRWRFMLLANRHDPMCHSSICTVRALLSSWAGHLAVILLTRCATRANATTGLSSCLRMSRKVEAAAAAAATISTSSVHRTTDLLFKYLRLNFPEILVLSTSNCT